MDYLNLNPALPANMLKVPPALLVGLILVALPTGEANAQSEIERRGDRVLTGMPVIDGRTDLPRAVRNSYGNNAVDIDLMKNGRQRAIPLRTDISKLGQGRVGGQFWSGWMPADVKSPEAILRGFEPTDMMLIIVGRCCDTLELAQSKPKRKQSNH